MGNVTGSAPFIIRTARLTDLDAITRVAQAGFPDDPEFNYRFPYRLEYPKDHWKWTRCEYEGYLKQPEKYAVVVAATPDAEDKPVAVSVWDIAVKITSTGGGIISDFSCPLTLRLTWPDNGINKRKDANPVHMEVWASVVEEGFERYFAKYGKHQIYLWLLTTHPDFRRQGAGTMLCHWGLKEATKKHWMLTVIGSPMGKSLYEHLGYGLVGILKIQAKGEEETLYEYCLEKKTV
jgi:ribosomal protein S18 acetylase RimI-like enzyme